MTSFLYHSADSFSMIKIVVSYNFNPKQFHVYKYDIFTLDSIAQ